MVEEHRDEVRDLVVGLAGAVLEPELDLGLQLVDIASGATVATAATGARVDVLAVSPDGRTLHVGGDDPARALSEVDARSGRVRGVTALPGPATALAPTPDGRRVLVAVGSAPPELVAVDVAGGAVVATAPLEPYAGRVSLAVGPGSATVSVANGDLGTLTSAVPR